MEEVVTKLCGVNNLVERAVKAAGNRIERVGSKKAFQATLLTLEELHCLSIYIVGGTFIKKHLSTVIKKMLEMEDTE